jgi:DNA-binding NarL/FixJ family response regulator
MTRSPSPPPLRIIVADDHELVRSGLRALLARMAGVTVVAEAPEGTQLLASLCSIGADIVLCDLGMPGMNGLDALDRMHTEHPQVRTLVVSMDDSAAAARRALAKGACGYLVKHAAASELEQAVRCVAAGRRYLSPVIELALSEGTSDSPEEQLTARQIEILRHIAQGHTARDIAEILGLSPNTVDVHRSRIMERLDIHDIASLTRYAMRHRLVS